MTLSWAVAWLVAINAATVFAFWRDKRLAANGGWRIRESTLLTLALLGGSPGTFYARRRFRHKTWKEPFGTHLITVCLWQLAAAIFFAFIRF